MCSASGGTVAFVRLGDSTIAPPPMSLLWRPLPRFFWAYEEGRVVTETNHLLRNKSRRRTSPLSTLGCRCARLRGALFGCRLRSSRSRLLCCLSFGSLLLDLLRFRHVIASLPRCLKSLQPASPIHCCLRGPRGLKGDKSNRSVKNYAIISSGREGGATALSIVVTS
jgi:hypothetical protein